MELNEKWKSTKQWIAVFCINSDEMKENFVNKKIFMSTFSCDGDKGEASYIQEPEKKNDVKLFA